MKHKSLVTPIIFLVFAFFVSAPAAHAGNVQRNRWEGLAIGIGTAILGSAIYSQYRRDHPQSYTAYTPRPTPGAGVSKHRDLGHHPRYGHGHKPPRHHRYQKHYDTGHRQRGHWEVRKEWVSPTYKKVWNPGHYNRRGKWISGHWIEIEDGPGYWSETRVWVAMR